MNQGVRHQRMLINGEWTDSADGGAFEVINPATEEVFATVARATTRDVARAVEAANQAFLAWSVRSPAQRGALLREASRLVSERSERIGRAMTEEQGKPLEEAVGEVRKGADILRYYAEEGERVYGRIIPNADPAVDSQVIYQPVGPCAAISPWNYPVELVAWKIGGALAAGCTLVVKPPSLTPISPLMFIECLVDAGIPAGVINACTGSGREVGRALIEDPRIKKVAFTGSTEVGRNLVQMCAAQFKKISLELGGHCPLIVCRDCDLEAAVAGAVRRTFRNMGQICIAINRIYVHRDIHDHFVEALAAKTRTLIIGNGLRTEPCDLGPMASAEGVQKSRKHIEDAVGKGAQVACGGQRPEGFDRGFFFEPTVLTGVDHTMRVMSEETFGPVVGVMSFDRLEEAVALANDTPYGLACYAYTNSLDEADRLARELQSGNVAINNVDAGTINAPYGGWKDSGSGYEHGPEGLYEYLQTKHIRLRYPNRG